MNELMIMMYCSLLNMKARFVNFMKEEKGGSEMIAMVLIIAIVLVLGGMFWDKISEFFDGLWSSAIGKDPMGNINPK